MCPGSCCRSSLRPCPPAGCSSGCPDCCSRCGCCCGCNCCRSSCWRCWSCSPPGLGPARSCISGGGGSSGTVLLEPKPRSSAANTAVAAMALPTAPPLFSTVPSSDTTTDMESTSSLCPLRSVSARLNGPAAAGSASGSMCGACAPAAAAASNGDSACAAPGPGPAAAGPVPLAERSGFKGMCAGWRGLGRGLRRSAAPCGALGPFCAMCKAACKVTEQACSAQRRPKPHARQIATAFDGSSRFSRVSNKKEHAFGTARHLHSPESLPLPQLASLRPPWRLAPPLTVATPAPPLAAQHWGCRPVWTAAPGATQTGHRHDPARARAAPRAARAAGWAAGKARSWRAAPAAAVLPRAGAPAPTPMPRGLWAATTRATSARWRANRGAAGSAAARRRGRGRPPAPTPDRWALHPTCLLRRRAPQASPAQRRPAGTARRARRCRGCRWCRCCAGAAAPGRVWLAATQAPPLPPPPAVHRLPPRSGRRRRRRLRTTSGGRCCAAMAPGPQAAPPAAGTTAAMQAQLPRRRGHGLERGAVLRRPPRPRRSRKGLRRRAHDRDRGRDRDHHRCYCRTQSPPAVLDSENV